MSDATTAPVAPEVFSLTDEDRGLITRKSTREAKPSIFLDQVQAAITSGEQVGIRITPEYTVSTIINNLNKAQDALGIKLRIWDRHEAPTPFVAFQVKPAAEAAPKK